LIAKRNENFRRNPTKGSGKTPGVLTLEARGEGGRVTGMLRLGDRPRENRRKGLLWESPTFQGAYFGLKNKEQKGKEARHGQSDCRRN